MILKNDKHPDGVELKPDRTVIEVSPCVTRKMTDEDWEKYGERNPVDVKRIKAEECEKFNVWMPTEADCEFAQRMREERLKRHMSQKKLAKVVGVSQNTICNYESLRYKPNKQIRLKIEKVLGLSGMNCKVSRMDELYPGQ